MCICFTFDLWENWIYPNLSFPASFPQFWLDCWEEWRWMLFWVSFLSPTLACQQSTDREGGEAEPGLCNQRWCLPRGPAALPDHSQDVSWGSIEIPYPGGWCCLVVLSGGWLSRSCVPESHQGSWVVVSNTSTSRDMSTCAFPYRKVG